MPASEAWPDIPFPAWQDTCATVQLWTQVAGKVRVALTPWLNHSWHVTLYVTARGLTTSPIPYGTRSFEIVFDFLDHDVRVETSDGGRWRAPLRAQPVADFYAELMSGLAGLGFAVEIDRKPNEVPDAIPLDADRVHASYDPERAQRFWRALVQVDRVFKLFRTGFIGKCSPVHLFWGSFDLAVTRFSGRPAPMHPGGVPNLPDPITREAYSHEVSSAGFWPGGGGIDYPAFYSYAYPVPPDFRTMPIRPAEAGFHEGLGEFLLPYDAVRNAADPDRALLEFLTSTYEAAANCAKWDRAGLEAPLGRPGIPRPVG